MMSSESLGEILFFSSNHCPANYMECDGRVLQVEQFKPLFKLIGNKFGGDGQTTFCIPDLTKARPFNTQLKFYIVAKDAEPPYEPTE